MPHRTPTARGISLAPLASFASSSSSLSPTPSCRKATAMYRKRRRDWSRDQELSEPEEEEEHDERMGRSHPTRGPRPPPPSWSSASSATDRKDQGDQDEEQGATTASYASVYREIQRSVDQVGAQVARARRDVAELRALLLQAAAQPTPTTRQSSSRDQATTSSKARVRIDRLCS